MSLIISMKNKHINNKRMNKFKLGKTLTKVEQLNIVGGSGETESGCKKPNVSSTSGGPGTVLLGSTFSIKDDDCYTTEPQSSNYDTCKAYQAAYLVWYAVCGQS